MGTYDECTVFMMSGAGERVAFTKFDGGRMVQAEGVVTEVTNDVVKVEHDGKSVAFRRAPGSKSGWGVGSAKAWRLGEEARRKLCHTDTPRMR